MEKNYVISKTENGKTIELQFSEIAENGKISFDYFKTADEKIVSKFSQFENVTVLFDKNLSWNEMESFTFKLKNKFKTIGTYITKINKIGNGYNPADRKNRIEKSNRLKIGKYGIEKIDNFTVKIFEIEKPENVVVVYFSKTGQFEKCEFSNDYENLSYYVSGLLSPNNWKNRIEQLTQFENGTICAEPEYILKIGEYKLSIGYNIPADLTESIVKFSDYLIREKQFALLAKLENLKPIKIGGGKKWLMDWLKEIGLYKINPLPKTN